LPTHRSVDRQETVRTQGQSGCVPDQASVGHRWRFYSTAAGKKPVKDFIDRLSDADAAAIAAAMVDVRKNGLGVARHLRGELFEVRADGIDASYRLQFAQEGARGRVLLALSAFSKKTQRTPPQAIALASSAPSGLAQSILLRTL
jgi:Phage derived protein Gp49-like (DUF891)